jgi:D-tyrosyl-tRNA(Tyr) deacylase
VKAVVQRVIDACVTVDGIVKGEIKTGLLVYLGVANDDCKKDADWLAEKVAYLRIFNDTDGIMNLSIKDITENNPAAGVLAISQFTLLGDARKGRRPSWHGAASPEKAKELYEYFINRIKKYELICERGESQAHMMVKYTNDGAVTIILESVNSMEFKDA